MGCAQTAAGHGERAALSALCVMLSLRCGVRFQIYEILGRKHTLLRVPAFTPASFSWVEKITVPFWTKPAAVVSCAVHYGMRKCL